MGLAYPQNVSILVGLDIQGVYEKVSPNICCPSHLVFLSSLENIFPVWPFCFTTTSFGQTEKRKVPHTMNDWSYTPATLFQLPASLWAWYFVEFNSQGHLPNYSQSAECRGQQQREDGARSALSHSAWEISAVRALWHFQRDTHLLLAPMELQIQQELRPPLTSKSSIFSFPPSFHWHT